MIDATHPRCIFRSPIATVLVTGVVAPAVIDHNLVLYRGLVEQPCEQLSAAPVGGRHFPFAVTEDDGWFVASNQILKLGEQMLAAIARLVSQPKGVKPLVERVVVPHAQPLPEPGVGQLAQYVAFWSGFDRIPRP